MFKRIHHINFVVRDLEHAVAQYENLSGVQFEYIEDHPTRLVKTARIKLSEVWLVLVQPMDMDSVPGRVLEQQGEGFFLISYMVDDIVAAIAAIKAHGGKMIDDKPRKGISNWYVADLDTSSSFGVMTQICQEIDE